MKPFILVIVIAFIPAMGSLAGEQGNDAILQASIERRAATQKALTESKDIGQAIAAVLVALKAEIEAPASGYLENSYVTNTEGFQLEYLKMLTDLGRKALPILATHVSKKQNPRVRDIVQAARGTLGDKTVYQELMAIIQDKHRDPFLRWRAVLVIGFLGKTESIPMLKALLRDSYYRDAGDDGGPFRIYPLREAACASLEELGVKISRKGNVFEVLNKK